MLRVVADQLEMVPSNSPLNIEDPSDDTVFHCRWRAQADIGEYIAISVFGQARKIIYPKAQIPI